MEHGVQACADPEARASLGPMEEAWLGQDWASQEPPGVGLEEGWRGAGVVVADLDGDELLDIFLPGRGACQLFLGEADGELRAAPEQLPPELPCEAWGASAADVDGDGDLDLLVVRDGAPDLLWRNDGAGQFEADPEAGLSRRPSGGRSAAWGDWEGDGDLDLFVANHVVGGIGTGGGGGPILGGGTLEADPNRLFRNLGHGRFEDASPELPAEALDGLGFLGAWIDADGDRDLDLYVVNDLGAAKEPNALVLQEADGSWSLAPAGHGLDLAIDGMGLGVGDLNADGIPDLAVTDVDRLHLMVSDALGWADHARFAGLEPDPDAGQTHSWGVELADLDNSGTLDLIVVFGDIEGDLDDEARLPQPDGLWLQDDGGRFEEQAAAWGLDQDIDGRGLALADLNQDGWLDVVKPDYRGGPARALLSRCGEAAWLRVRVEGEGHNTRGVGAEVVAWAEGRPHRGWIQAGSSSLGSSAPPEVHLGLGDAERVELLEISWPQGGTSSWRDLATRQVLTAVQAEAPLD